MIRDNNYNNTMALIRVIAILMVVMVHLGQSLSVSYCFSKLFFVGNTGLFYFILFAAFLLLNHLVKTIIF